MLKVISPERFQELVEGQELSPEEKIINRKEIDDFLNDFKSRLLAFLPEENLKNILAENLEKLLNPDTVDLKFEYNSNIQNQVLTYKVSIAALVCEMQLERIFDFISFLQELLSAHRQEVEKLSEGINAFERKIQNNRIRFRTLSEEAKDEENEEIKQKKLDELDTQLQGMQRKLEAKQQKLSKLNQKKPLDPYLNYDLRQIKDSNLKVPFRVSPLQCNFTDLCFTPYKELAPEVKKQSQKTKILILTILSFLVLLEVECEKAKNKTKKASTTREQYTDFDIYGLSPSLNALALAQRQKVQLTPSEMKNINNDLRVIDEIKIKNIIKPTGATVLGNGQTLLDFEIMNINLSSNAHIIFEILDTNNKTLGLMLNYSKNISLPIDSNHKDFKVGLIVNWSTESGRKLSYHAVLNDSFEMPPV